MHKDEIIQLHGFLLQVRSFIEDSIELKKDDVFSSYEKLDVGPQHVVKSKDNQKSAVFELCKGIKNLLQNKK